MTPTSAARFSNALGLLAAMTYLATFLAFSYGVYEFTRGESFLAGIAQAYPYAVACSVLVFLACTAIESLKATLKKMRGVGKHVTAHSLAHR